MYILDCEFDNIIPFLMLTNEIIRISYQKRQPRRLMSVKINNYKL